MSVSMTKSEGVTVMTMTSDPGSACPPFCQILKALCYSPVCCDVSQKLRSVLGTSHSALGAMQVMVGLMNIGLGVILSPSVSRYLLWEFGYFPSWMGSLFIVFGLLCILSEKFPSLCLVASSVTAQLCGIGLSITAVVLYFINLFDGERGSWPCEADNYYRSDWGTTGTPIDNSSDMEKCLEGLSIIKTILRGVNGLLIILSVLQLCLSISCVVLGIKAIKKGFKKENQVFHCWIIEKVSCSLDPANTQPMSGFLARGWGPQKPPRWCPRPPPGWCPRPPPGWCPRPPPGWCPQPPPGWCQALLDALVRNLKRLCCTLTPGLLISSPAVLGTIQILIGLVTVGLGPGRTSTGPGDLTQLGAPYWLGAVFLVSGILCILSGDYPSVVLVGFAVAVNICGAILAITGIVLYAIDLSHSSLAWMCPSPSTREPYDVRHHGYADHHGDSAASLAMLRARLNQDLQGECIAMAHIAEGLLSMMDILLIILTILQLCVSLSTTILMLEALIWPRDHNKCCRNAEMKLTESVPTKCITI